MSLQELSRSFGVMFPAFSLPMKAERSRNKERLEASLAGLCELELLKQRQECRVLNALCLGDVPFAGRPPWGALRSTRCALDAPNGNASDEYGLGLKSVSCAAEYIRGIVCTSVYLYSICIWTRDKRPVLCVMAHTSQNFAMRNVVRSRSS